MMEEYHSYKLWLVVMKAICFSLDTRENILETTNLVSAWPGRAAQAEERVWHEPNWTFLRAGQLDLNTARLLVGFKIKYPSQSVHDDFI